MKLPLKVLSICSLITLNTLGLYPNNNQVLAQFRGQDSQEFFDRGNQLMEQKIQEIQQQNVPKIDINKEEKEPPLEVKNPDKTSTEEVPDIDLKLYNNVPESPLEEIKIEQN